MRDFIAHVRRHLSRRDVAEDRYDEVVDELASELEARYAALVQRGATDEDAWNAVARTDAVMACHWRSDLAMADRHRPGQQSHAARGCALSSASIAGLQDLKLATRALRKDRGFTVDGDRHARRLSRRPRRDRRRRQRRAAPSAPSSGTGARTPDGQSVPARRNTAGDEQRDTRLRGSPSTRHRRSRSRRSTTTRERRSRSAASRRARWASWPRRLSSVSFAYVPRMGASSPRAKAPLATTSESSSATDSGASSTAAIRRPSAARCGSPGATSRSSASFRRSSRSAVPASASGFRWP